MPSKNSRRADKPLSAQMKMFVAEYLADETRNGSAAAIRAGYSTRNARGQAYKMLNDPRILREVIEQTERRTTRLAIDADYILQRHMEIDSLNYKDLFGSDERLLPIKDWPDAFTRTLSGIDVATITELGDDEEAIETVIKKIKLPCKQTNLVNMGKHVDVQAYKERLEIAADGYLVEELVAARKRAEKAKG